MLLKITDLCKRHKWGHMKPRVSPGSPGEIYQLLPVGPEAVKIEVLSLPAEVIVWVFVPLQDGTEGPTGLHCCLQLTQRIVGQKRNGNVIKQSLTECLERGKEKNTRKTLAELAQNGFSRYSH